MTTTTLPPPNPPRGPMEIATYGHADLDAAITRHRLYKAGARLSPHDWPDVLHDLAPAYYDHAEASGAVLRIHPGGDRKPEYAPATSAEQFRTMVCATAQAIRDELLQSAIYMHRFGDLSGLPYRIEFKHVAGPETGLRLVVAVVELPTWIHYDGWQLLADDTRRHFHIVDYSLLLRATRAAWVQASVA